MRKSPISGIVISMILLICALLACPSKALAEGPVWTSSGECEWSVDSEGVLIIRPANNKNTAELEDWGSGQPGWVANADRIFAVRIEGNVIAPNTSGMFFGLYNVKNIDLSGLDTSKTQDMGSMFYGCSALTDLNLGKLNTSKVEYTSGMFDGCSRLRDVNLSSFDTSAVKSMLGMFRGCGSLKSLDVSSFDTSQVSDMSSMFSGCSSIISLDLSNFDTSSVTNMADMFSRCANLKRLDVSSFDTSRVTKMDCMFQQMGLSELDLSNFDTSNVTDMFRMFAWSDSLSALDLSNFDTSLVGSTGYGGMAEMFVGCTGLKSLDVSSFDTSKVSRMYYMFGNCSSLESLDLSSFETSSVEEMSCMFFGCSALRFLDLSGFDTTYVQRMSQMFNGCTGLIWLDISSFDTSNVSDMGAMFKNMDSLRMVRLGERFSFCGATEIRLCSLPLPAVAGYTGRWENVLLGVSYLPNEIPNNVAAQYSAQRGSTDESLAFTDVSDSTPHARHIAWLASEGISLGFSDGSFRPYDFVKRCDMAAFLYRLAGKPDFTPTKADWDLFGDVNVQVPHAREILWLASTGISTGYPDGTFRPYDNVARCDMAAFLHRLAGNWIPPQESPVVFSDVHGDTPHSYDIHWLAAVGVSTGFPDGTFRPFEYIARCDMAAFLHRMEGVDALKF